MTASPYQNRPAHTFWRKGVADRTPNTITDLYRKKFSIPARAGIATAGSCFAQHIARHLRKSGYQVIDEEPAPTGLRSNDMGRFGYGLFSARYANIYVTRQLVQLIREARGEIAPSDPVWERDGRYFDAQRPNVEPLGLGSRDDVMAHREEHLAAVRRVVDAADVFVFTFGLTEAWIHRQSGTVYPTAPGTFAGAYDPAVYAFKNFTFNEIYEDFVTFRAILKRAKPEVKFIVTVSPVPLTATASDEHVLVATTYSKSVLRAVAGQLYKEFDDIDYFPSYELIATPFSKGTFYESNLREVTSDGVATAMRQFIQEHAMDPAARKPSGQQTVATLRPVALPQTDDDVVCEDIMLDAFAK